MKYKLPDKSTISESKDNRETRDNTIVDIIRAAGQGLSFGFGDELEAFVRSKLDEGKSYDEIVKEVRSEISQFREKSPVLAYGSEIAGSIPTALLGGAGIAKTGATIGKLGIEAAPKAAAKVASKFQNPIVQGAIYGAGTGEDLEGRTIGAAIGGTASGVISKFANTVLPKVSETAKEYIKTFTPKLGDDANIWQKLWHSVGGDKPSLTIGQKYAGSGGGLFGKLINVLEETATGVPGIGSSIQKGRLKNLLTYNTFNLNKILEPLGLKLPKGMYGHEAYDYIDNAISDAYNKVIPKISLKDTDILFNKITSVLDESTLGKEGTDKVYQFISKKILDKIESGQLSGNNIKVIESELTKEIGKFSRAGGFEADIGEVFSIVRNIIREEIELQNGSLSELQAINKAFNLSTKVSDAIIKSARNQGIFTPTSLLSSLKKLDTSIRKKSFAKGKVPLQKETQLAEETLGGKFPESGTASRIISGGMVQDPGEAIKYAIPSIFSDWAYSRPGSAAISGLLNLPGNIARRSAPTAGGLLAEKTTPLEINIPVWEMFQKENK